MLAGLRRTLGRWLQSEGVAENDLFNITLAVSEAAANAIEHAYGAHEATFRVTGSHEGEEVRVTVSDGGRWRSSRPYGRGRGLAIMRALVDDAEIERGKDGTSVTLIKRVGRPTRRRKSGDAPRRRTSRRRPGRAPARRRRRSQRRRRCANSLPSASIPAPTA